MTGISKDGILMLPKSHLISFQASQWFGPVSLVAFLKRILVSNANL